MEIRDWQLNIIWWIAEENIILIAIVKCYWEKIVKAAIKEDPLGDETVWSNLLLMKMGNKHRCKDYLLNKDPALLVIQYV